MSISKNVSDDGMNVKINIKGRFDYKVSREFHDAYRHVPARDGIAYYVDLRDVDYMDSSALGMLLVLREHAKCRGGEVTIEHPNEPIDKILKVANFEQLFTIDYSSHMYAG